MEASAVSAEATAKANELYWGSNRSVNQIADDLDLSKGALYQIIVPLDAGSACPRCGSEVVYPNRTAKERGLVDCPECEWDGSTDEAVQPEDARRAGGPPVRRRAEAVSAPPAPTPDGAGMRSVVGGALLGAAAGLALVLWARRR